jgi:outer membrane protein
LKNSRDSPVVLANADAGRMVMARPKPIIAVLRKGATADIQHWSPGARIRMKIATLTIVLAALAVASPLRAQRTDQGVPESLTLQEALEIARSANPGFRQTRNDERLADWDVRQAYGRLFPQVTASASLGWQGTGEQQFGTVTLGDLGFGNQPSYYTSGYRLGVNYTLDWATILGPSQAKANRVTTQAQIQLAESNLESQVTNAYLEMLRQQEAVRIAEAQLENSQFNLRLAQAQLEVGAVTGIDVGQAEVQVGRSEVQTLQARNALETARMRLLQQLGQPMGADFELSTPFELSEPTWNVEELQEMALMDNPTLGVRRASRDAADIGVSSARGSYYPTMSISTGWSGFTREASNTDFQIAQAQAQVANSIAQCTATNELYSRLTPPLPSIDCTRFAFTDAQRQAIVDQNNQFPFGFIRSPPTVTLALSVPIFSGLSRQRNLEAARLQREDVTEQIREQEIALEADISIGLANVRTAYQSALLEERNRQLAEQQLELARERYQLGEITFVDLVSAQTVLAQAEVDQIQAVFNYHDLVTSLEALVGTSLRN